MGANDTLEQLRAAQAYAVELEAANVLLYAALASLTTDEMLDVAYESGGSEPPRLVQAAREALGADTDAALRELRAKVAESFAEWVVRTGEGYMADERCLAADFAADFAVAIREGRA